MDRSIVYPGSIPLDTDILNIQQRTMAAIGALVQATMGTSTFADGLACTQTTVPSLSVTVAQGWLGSLTTLEPNAYGSISADAVTPLMKMGINLAATNLGPMSAPGTAGQSVVYLVQASFSEADTSAVVLPYYNASNPAVPYSGPANAGTSQNTKRAQTVTLQLKQGTAATTGSQTTPAPDSGFTGLYAITIANGAVTVVNANIATVTGAPFLNASAGQGIKPGRLLNIQYFKTAGASTYIPTLGTTSVVVEVQAGGGAGGGAVATGAAQVSLGATGSSGSYARKRITSAFSGVTVTVGAGGTPSAGANGGNGGASSFGAVVSAAGGIGGYAAAATGSSGNFNISSTSAPGLPSNGDLNLSGQVTIATAYIGGISIIPPPAPAPGPFGQTYGASGVGVSNGASASAIAGLAGASGIVVVYEYS